MLLKKLLSFSYFYSAISLNGSGLLSQGHKIKLRLCASNCADKDKLAILTLKHWFVLSNNFFLS